MQKVTVYGFKKYEVTIDDVVFSRLKATAACIERIKAEKVPGTEEEVDASKLNGDGMYDPQKAVQGG